MIICCSTLLFSNPAFSANLIHKLDFESTGWEDSFRSGSWEGKVTRTTSNPHSGSYSLRGNLMEARGTDPITGLDCEANPQLEYVGNDISSQTPNEIYIKYWRRFDDANWDGTENGYGKGEYLTDDEDSVKAFYTRMAWGPNNYALSQNGAYWDFCNDDENWGYSKAYFAGPDPGGADGQWHKFEFYVNYKENYIKMWVDDILLTSDDATNGQLPLPEEFHLRGLQLLYVHSAQVSQSTDGEGYACGYQFDDIEVWDGIPGTQNQVLSPPKNLNVVSEN